MGVWGWIGLLVVLWEKWGGPYGRVGPGAYLMAGAQGEVYLGEGRWVWRLSGGRWESVGLLPGEGRTGAVDAEGRLWIAGLNSLYFQKERHTHTLPLPQAGWGEMLWQLPSGIAIRGTSRSFWIPYSPQLKAYPLPGVLIGADTAGLWVQQGDTILRGYPSGWEVAFLCPIPLQALSWQGETGWVLSRQGGLYRLTRKGLFKVVEGVRLLTGQYYIQANQVYALPEKTPLWKGAEDIYTACRGLNGDILWLLSPTGLTALYPRTGARWQHIFPGVFTSWKKDSTHWVVWQGETAYLPEKGTSHRYPAILIDAAHRHSPEKGFWLWATPSGLLDESGRFIAEQGYYIKSVDARGEKLAWAVGKEVFIQTASNERRRYTFPMVVQGVGWANDTLWAWGGTYVYYYTRSGWRGEKVGGFIEEGRVWEGRLGIRVGTGWLWRHRTGWDTLSEAPWLRSALPVSATWGRLLAAWRTENKRYLLLSHGLIEIAERQLALPPLHLQTTLTGPGLQRTGTNTYEVPAEKAFLSLSWEVIAPFLPAYATVYYQIGEQPLMVAAGRELLLNLPPEGDVPLRLLVSHPWYAQPRSYEWVIRVIPPWYKTTYARVGAGVLVLLLLSAGVALREWYHRQLQRRLAAERAALSEKVQRQQTQILQNERMANLGVMAAHIAHEINTPLGIIQSALAEVESRLASLRPPVIKPQQPPQTPAERRALYEVWQKMHPDLSAALLQQLATLGYTPSQWPDLAPLLESPHTLPTWLTWVQVDTYLSQARVAAEKLQQRVQRIRTYVREIRESSEETRFSLQESLSRTLDFYKPLLRKVHVETQWPPEPLWVKGDPARLDQVWANLIQNAIQAMPPEKGYLRIEVRREETNRALILIQDNGHGIPPEIRERIFDPLFTTKAPGEGTGLGLPICRQIVELHGGQLRLLHSEPGYTLFGVWLPLVEEPKEGK